MSPISIQTEYTSKTPSPTNRESELHAFPKQNPIVVSPISYTQEFISQADREGKRNAKNATPIEHKN